MGKGRRHGEFDTAHTGAQQRSDLQELEADSPAQCPCEPSVPGPWWSSVQLEARDATDAAIAKSGTPVVRVNELDERFASCLGRRLTPGLGASKSGFGDVEHLSAGLSSPLSAMFEICRDDRICWQGKC